MFADMSFNFDDKTFWVTGASSGMGQAIAKALALSGAKLVLSARNIQNLQLTQQICVDLGSPQVDILSLDMEDPTVGKQAGAFLGDRPLSGLLLNGGGPHGGKPSQLRADDLNQAHRLLLLGPTLLLNALLPNLRDASVVSITSTTVKEFNPELPLSCAYRCAFVALLKCYAHEMSSQGTRFNNIAPGYIDTENLGGLKSYIAQKSNVSQVQVENSWKQLAMLKRLGTPEEVAQLALFFFSKESSFVTAQTWLIDGGQTHGY
jgi:3-oxoacyl-[acyl-carrier protein] reductase